MPKHKKVTDLTALQPEALCSFAQAAAILNIDASFIPSLIRDGKLDWVLVGTRKRIPRWALRAYEEREIRARGDRLRDALSNTRPFVLSLPRKLID